MIRRSTRRAGAAAAIAALVLTLGACGGGSDEDTDTATDDTTTETTVTDTPSPTFAADREAAFLQASKDSRAGKLAEVDDNTKLEAGRASCEGLKQGLTGREVYDTIRKELPSQDVKDEELGFFIGAAVGAMCPDQEEQLKKGF